MEAGLDKPRNNARERQSVEGNKVNNFSSFSLIARRRQESNPLKLGRRKKKKKGIDAAVKLPTGRLSSS